MKTLIIVLFLLTLGWILPQHSQAQVNLVPNPSFEIYDICPDSLFQFRRLQNWFESRQSPDFYHVCDPPNATNWKDSVSVPANAAGYQFPNSGSGYAGFVAYSEPFPSYQIAREFLSVKLNDPLIIGQQYFVSFYLSLTTPRGNESLKYASNNQGILFTMDSTLHTDTTYPLGINNFAHIYSNSLILDSSIWTKVTGSFIADSSYEYLSIGNFFNDSLTSSFLIFPNGNNSLSYYYIDDVCVSVDSTLCFSPVSMNEYSNDVIQVYPNPCMDYLIIETNQLRYNELIIYNSIGEIILKMGPRLSKYFINTSNWSSGMYFLRIADKKFMKIIKLD